MTNKEIGDKLGVSRQTAWKLLTKGRIIINEDGTIERKKRTTISGIRLKIMEVNGMTRESAYYHHKNGSYDPETFIVKKNKPGPKPKPASNVQ
jgi:hypothetical protein